MSVTIVIAKAERDYLQRHFRTLAPNHSRELPILIMRLRVRQTHAVKELLKTRIAAQRFESAARYLKIGKFGITFVAGLV